MKIRNFVPTLFIAAGSVLCSCGGKAPVNKVVQLADDPKFKTIVADTFSRQLTDERKVVEFNRLLKKYGHKVENYIVVDKKKCVAKVYSPDGNVMEISEVALGKNIGDKRGGGYKVKGAKLEAYTTPGEFEIAQEGTLPTSVDHKLYGNRVLTLIGDHTKEAYKRTQILALHRVPSSPMGKLRENVFNNKTLADNRVSFGCVNFLVESYDKMRALIKGKSTKVYILPEEKGNSLYLEKQNNGTFKFFQKKYRYESQESIKKSIK